jgi:hypothetical protein
LDAPADLKQFVLDHFSPTSIDQLTNRIFKEGLENSLVELFISIAEGRDFVLDSYVPAEFHQKIVGYMREQGYFPVLLRWELVGEPLCSISQSERRADAFYRDLERTAVEYREPQKKSVRINGTVGYLERISINNGLLQVRGWALNEAGKMPGLLEIHVGREKYFFNEFTKLNRQDVQRHFGLDHALCGFSINAKVPEGLPVDEIKDSVRIFAGNAQDRLHPLKRIEEAGRQGRKTRKSFRDRLRGFVKRKD